MTFTEVPDPPQLRAFSVRGQVLYAGTDNFANGYAIATSADDGDTWTALMRYQQVQAVPACVRSLCRTQCELLTPKLWAADVCSADAPPPPIDAAVAEDGGPPDADRPDAAAPADRGTDDANGPPNKGGGGGCGCALASPGGVTEEPRGPLGVAGGLAAVVIARRRRRLAQ